MSKYLFFVTFFIFFANCMAFSGSTLAPSQTVYKLAHQIGDVINVQYGLKAIGSGGSFPDKLKNIFLHFDTKQKLKLDDARKLIVAVTEEFVSQMANCEDIKPFLEQYPPTNANTRIFIQFSDMKNDFLSPPYIALITMSDGKVSYGYYDNNKEQFIMEMSHTETFEEAKEIIRNQEGSK